MKPIPCFIVLGMFFSPPCALAGEPSRDVTALRFSSTGAKLAVGLAHGQADVWDVKSNERRALPADSHEAVYAVYFRNDDTQIVVVERQGTIRIHDAATGTLLASLWIDFGEDEELAVAALDPAGSVLAVSGNKSRRISFVGLDDALDARSRKSDAVVRIDVSRQGTSGPRRPVRGTASDGRSGLYTDLRFCPSIDRFVASGSDGTLVAWDDAPWQSGGSKEPFYLRQAGDPAAMFKDLLGLDCGQSGLILTAGYHSDAHGQIQLWDAASGTLLDHVSGAHPGTARRAAWDRQGRLAVTTGDLRYILWERRENKLQPIAKIHFSRSAGLLSLPTAVDFSPDRKFAAFGDGANVYVADLSTLAIVTVLGEQGSRLLIEPFQ